MLNSLFRILGLLPLLCIIFCNMITYYLFRALSNESYYLTPLASNSSSLLEFLVLPSINIFIMCIFLFSCKHLPVYSIVQRSYLSIGLFTLVFLYLASSSLLPVQNSSSYAIEAGSFLSDLATHWVPAILYLLTSLWAPLTILLFYSYFNNVINFENACKLYPALSIFSLIMSEFVMPKMTALLLQGSLQEKMHTMPIIFIFCLTAIMGSFYWVNRHLTREAKMTFGESEERHSSKNRTFLYCLIFLTITVGFTKYISIATLDFSVQLKDTIPKNYRALLESYTFLKDLSILLAIILVGFLSSYLYHNKANGWKSLCNLSINIIALLLATLIIIKITNGSHGTYSTKNDPTLFTKLLSNVGGIYQIFIGTILYPTLMCLKNLVLVPLPYYDRFRFNVIIELAFHKAGYFIAVLLQIYIQSTAEFNMSVLYTLTICLISVFLIRILTNNFGRHTPEAA